MMSKVYLIGDTHWGHKNAIKWREQFSTPEEHDEIIFDNIMSTVTKRDTLWLLGDCIMDNQALIKLDDPRYFNVSCENINYTPINYQEILGRMKDVRE